MKIVIKNIYFTHEFKINRPCQVGCSSGIHRLHLCTGVRPPNKCPRYETKQSDGGIPVMQELWEMWSTPFSRVHSGYQFYSGVKLV